MCWSAVSSPAYESGSSIVIITQPSFREKDTGLVADLCTLLHPALELQLATDKRGYIKLTNAGQHPQIF